MENISKRSNNLEEYQEIYKCRICGSTKLNPILDLGNQLLTGVFPKHINSELTSGPLSLVLCTECSLVQLKHTYNLFEMYGENYGYRSGLNQTMVNHLNGLVNYLEKKVALNIGDIVLDIGSNDATLLKAYKTGGLQRVGIDPAGGKFMEYYDKDIYLLEDFFSAKIYQDAFPATKAKIITSISMFYDLESPRDFVQDIYKILDCNGVWYFEQSYLPEMLRMNSYDTICHEHLEYYSFQVVNNLLQECDLKVLDVQKNGINGGSFAVTAAKKSAKWPVNFKIIKHFLEEEKKLKLNAAETFRNFEKRIIRHRETLKKLIDNINNEKKLVLGYGASTKGNVILQFCDFTARDIPLIAEVNEDKYNSFTPGSWIPIAPEEEIRKMKPDYLLVLPWHYRNSIIEREALYLASGGKLIFPLPEIKIIER